MSICEAWGCYCSSQRKSNRRVFNVHYFPLLEKQPSDPYRIVIRENGNSKLSKRYYVDRISIRDTGLRDTDTEHIETPTSQQNRVQSNSSTHSLLGTLPSGERFVMYRFSLFTDGFQVSRNKNNPRSAGGVYLLPMSLPPSVRKSTRRIHRVTLTHPHVCDETECFVFNIGLVCVRSS